MFQHVNNFDYDSVSSKDVTKLIKQKVPTNAEVVKNSYAAGSFNNLLLRTQEFYVAKKAAEDNRQAEWVTRWAESLGDEQTKTKHKS